MSTFSGKQGKGAMKKRRAWKKVEAQARQAEYDKRSPILAPPPPPYVVAKVNGQYVHRPSSRGDAQSALEGIESLPLKRVQVSTGKQFGKEAAVESYTINGKTYPSREAVTKAFEGDPALSLIVSAHLEH